MKKFLALAILSVSSLAFVPSAEAKSSSGSTAATTTVAVEPQIIIRTPNRRYQRRARVVTQTRNVRRGRALYRETYQTTYRPNGRVVTRLISRVRIR